jgi:SNF2 family DNA or RNA helicase
VIDRKNRAPFIQAVQTDNYEYFICHVEALRLMPELANVSFAHVIVDECQRIKNRKAQQTLAVKRLKTVYKTAMSGTPADDKPADLWSILNWLYPVAFSNYWKFVNTYCVVTKEEIQARKGLIVTNKVGGVKEDMVPVLMKRLAPFYVRRLKKDMLPELPEKYYSRVTVDLPPPQRKIYDDLREEMLAWLGEHRDEPLSVTTVVSQLIRLQQAALATLDFSSEGRVTLIEPSAKLDALVELIGDEKPLPLVVFSQSRSMINLTADRLSREGLRVAKYHGDIKDAIRDKAKEDFQARKMDVFAGTIAAGGEGINLFVSSTVVFLDRSWSPSRNKQAEDRLHRSGQKNAVQVVDFVASDTVDKRVRQANVYKAHNLALILGDLLKRRQP